MNIADVQSDLGGLVYEMAIRDSYRLDVITRRAAKLQAVDAQLTEVERSIAALAQTPIAPAPARTAAAPAAPRTPARPIAPPACPACGRQIAGGAIVLRQLRSSLARSDAAAPRTFQPTGR